MKRSGKSILLLVVALFVGAGIGSALGQTFTQGDDPLLVTPEILIIVDTSGSMDTYIDNTHTLKRYTAVRQVLTGSYNTCGIGTCCANQRADGILDVYKDVIRFGFATYDDDRPGGNCDHRRGTGTYNYPLCPYGDSGPKTCVGTNCVPGCNDGTQGGGKLGIKGRDATQGKLIDLVDPASPSDLLGNNAKVQTAACNTTADSCTPLNAALFDARYYYQNWQTEIGYNDQMDAYGCRAKFVLLLTDGENNGPIDYGYSTPEQEAANLYSMGVPVYVVGFAEDLASYLNPIQKAGSGGLITEAYIAQNPQDLYNDFNSIFLSVLAGEASRTSMVSAPSLISTSQSYAYTAWMRITASGLGWNGHLARIPVLGVDENTGLPLLDTNHANWVYFENVLAAQNASDRDIYTVVNDPRSQTFSPIDRPVDTNPLRGLYPFKSSYNAAQLEPLMCLQNTEGVTNAVLMDRIRDFVRGVPGSFSRNDTLVNTGPYLGDIFHSNPLIVQPPSALTPDFRYEAFFQQYKNRPSMIYVGANDGMLHAFIAEQSDPSATDPVGKELWAFIPTNLISNIQQTRWGHSTFVDGSPVVKDMLFQGLPATDSSGNPLYDNSHVPIMGAYRTVLVTGERGGGSAYFALDVTDPYHPKYFWEYRTDLSTNADYTNSQFQCRDSKLQSWSSPILGQVWLKNKNPALFNGREFQGRPVMIVPGGYMPPQALTQASSCIEFMEGLSSASSIHVVDIETGKLLKKVMFSDSITSAMQTDINNFYNTITANSCYTNPNDSHCKPWSPGAWQSSNYGSGSGWSCTEKRASIGHQLPIPPALLDSTKCSVTEDASQYDIKCCDAPPSGNPANCSWASNVCYYHYKKKKTVTGGMTVELKTDNCTLVTDANDRGHFTLTIEDNFQTESVNATGAAFDTTFGEYITRVFVPTTTGKIYRIDLSLGEYDPTASEGNMVGAFTIGSITYKWDVGRLSPTGPPEPWYDTIVDTSNVQRPIMVSPTIALDYDRNLVLFFGSGVIDNLEYSDTWDYIWAVKETSQYNSSHQRLEYDVHGTKVGPKLRLPEKSERLFSKPLVLGGNVYFSTYIPVTSTCLPGRGAIYGKNFTDLSEDVITKKDLPPNQPPEGPTVVWTPTGPAIVIKQGGTGFQSIGASSIKPAAHILHWGRVL